MNTLSPFAKPLYIMAKPAGSLCNLACKYCYYLEKSNLYQDNPKHIMSDELLEKFIKEYIEAQTMPQVLFTWHGGETLMRPISFYEKVISLQQKYARGRTVDNCIQTNGTLLTDDWCRFFHDNNWLVGISIDGPQEFHDEYRKNKQGKPSFVKVMQGISLLNKHHVEWNALAVVNDYNADYPLEFYHFFKQIGCRYIQFAPIVERILPHNDGRHLAAVNEGTEEGLADFPSLPSSGAISCVRFLMNGSARMWESISYNFSMLHWQTGWEVSRVSVRWPRPADMQESWNSMVMCIRAIILSFLNISWEISILILW